MRRIALAVAASLAVVSCSHPEPTESLGALKQQLGAVDSFCIGKDGDVYPECAINRDLLQAQFDGMTTVAAGLPPPPARTPEEAAATIARTRAIDAEWRARGVLGRVPREYARQLTFARRSLALFRNPNLDPDALSLEFRSIPYPGIVCGTEALRDMAGIYTETARFVAYFTAGGKLAKVAEPVPVEPKQYDALYADRLNGPFAATDEAALLRICGMVAAG